MARVLRNRAIVIAEDNTASTNNPSSSLDTTISASNIPLEEIHTNDEAMTVDNVELEQELKSLKAAYKTALGVQKKRKPRRVKKEEIVQQVEVVSKILDDDQSITAPTTIGSVQEVNQGGKGSIGELVTPLQEFHLTDSEVTSTETQDHGEQATLASSQPCNQIAEQNDTVQAELDGKIADAIVPNNLEVSGTNDLPVEGTTEGVDASLKASPEVEQASEPAVESFANEGLTTTQSLSEIATETLADESAPTRSAGKHISRIEDSVEALDQFEEALEAINELTQQSTVPTSNKIKSTPITRPMPSSSSRKTAPKTNTANTSSARSQTLGRNSIHPVVAEPKSKTNSLGRKSLNPTRHEPKMLATEKLSKSVHSRSVSAASAGTTPSSEAVATRKVPIKRPTSLLPPKQPAKSTKLPTRATFELPGEAVARKLKEQREARIAERATNENKPPASYTINGLGRASSRRSSKPPTRPANFELPGEALSRRKREAHEERLKAQEEEIRLRREFKAKRIRTSIAPGMLPRNTAATLPRRSQIGVKEAPLGGRSFTDNSLKRNSVIVGTHRPSILAGSQALSNTPASRSLSSIAPVANVSRKASASNTNGVTSKRESSIFDPRIKAKEVFNRGMVAHEDAEREKREREERARKSREEAAERGREASRKWAEQQLAKRVREGGDIKLEPGFGPGGQMGLPTSV